MLRQNIHGEPDPTESIDYPAYMRRKARVLKAMGVARPFQVSENDVSRRLEPISFRVEGLPWVLFLVRRKAASCAFWTVLFFRWRLPRMLRRLW